MSTGQVFSASAPPPISLQVARVKRRISASDSVVAMMADLAFGAGARDDHARLVGLVADRVGAAGGVRA